MTSKILMIQKIPVLVLIMAPVLIPVQSRFNSGQVLIPVLVPELFSSPGPGVKTGPCKQGVVDPNRPPCQYSHPHIWSNFGSIMPNHLNMHIPKTNICGSLHVWRPNSEFGPPNFRTLSTKFFKDLNQKPATY